MNQQISRVQRNSPAFLKQAIEQDRVGLAIQAINSIAEPDRLLYSECLARIVEPDGSVLTASDFVLQFEQLGICHLLDHRIALLAFEQLERNPDSILGCNVSSDCLGNEAAWGDFLHAISAHRDLAGRLVLEVTESRPQADLFEARERLTSARELGCKIAIDNFGLGFLAPSNLLLLDADIVKIDASLLRDLRTGADGKNSLDHIVGFASCLAPVVVVEGVEMPAQLDLARRAGATHVQGHLISEPVSPQLLRARRDMSRD